MARSAGRSPRASSAAPRRSVSASSSVKLTQAASLMKAGLSGMRRAVSRSAWPTVRSIHAPALKNAAAFDAAPYATPSSRCSIAAISVRGDDAHAVAIEDLDASREPARKKPVPNRRLKAELLAPELERLARLDDPVLGQRSAH